MKLFTDDLEVLMNSRNKRSITDTLKEDLDDFGRFLRDIFDNADYDNITMIDSVTNKLEKNRNLVTKSAKRLASTKLTICSGVLTKFYNAFDKIQNVELTNCKFDQATLKKFISEITDSDVSMLIKGGPALTAMMDSITDKTDQEFLELFKAMATPVYDSAIKVFNDLKDGTADEIMQRIINLGEEIDLMDDDFAKEVICPMLYGGIGYINAATSAIGLRGTESAESRELTMAFLGGGPLETDMLRENCKLLGEEASRSVLAVCGHIMGIKDDYNNCCFNDDGKKKCEILKEYILLDIELAIACNDQARTKRVNKQIEILATHCKEIQERSDLFNGLLRQLSERLAAAVVKLDAIMELAGTDYQAYPPQAKQIIGGLLANVQAAQALLETPLLDDDGALTEESKRVGESVEAFLSQA